MSESQTPEQLKKRLERLFRFMGAKSFKDGAQQLGIQPVSVSRWVNGHGSPCHTSLKLIELAEQHYCHE